MARAPTTLDAFNAVAEPRRRRVLDVLARGGEWPVNHLVARLGWPQPQVSKHLGVLREVGLVHVRRSGRQQMYTLNAAPLKSIHEWVGTFEKLWSDHLRRIKERAEEQARAKVKQSRGGAAGLSEKENPKHRSEGHG